MVESRSLKGLWGRVDVVDDGFLLVELMWLTMGFYFSYGSAILYTHWSPVGISALPSEIAKVG